MRTQSVNLTFISIMFMTHIHQYTRKRADRSTGTRQACTEREREREKKLTVYSFLMVPSWHEGCILKICLFMAVMLTCSSGGHGQEPLSNKRTKIHIHIW